MPVESISVRQARRLALLRAGLLRPELTELPARAAGRGKRARERAHAVIDRFGYLQLDSIAVTGARTHGIVLASRLERFDTSLAETLLAPGEPLFEYWGHEASWLPIALYPAFEFRRRDFRIHPWWGDLLGEHAGLAKELMKRIEQEGPLRSLDLEGESSGGSWKLKLASRIAEALWSAGDLAVRERRAFQRSFDLTERVIPAEARARPLDEPDALDLLLLRALDGHGWATRGTLAATWRLVRRGEQVRTSLERLVESGAVVRCDLRTKERTVPGFIRRRDLEVLPALDACRPSTARAVLLSPFDPVLWDRDRVRQLFGFEQVLEIYKPAVQRRFGYYCLPVLAGDRLVARVDLKADRRAGTVAVRAVHHEAGTRLGDSKLQRTVEVALQRFAVSTSLEVA